MDNSPAILPLTAIDMGVLSNQKTSCKERNTPFSQAQIFKS